MSFVNSKEVIYLQNIVYNKINSLEVFWGVIVLCIGEAVKIRILDLCKENNITVNKLATICGITQSTLNNIVSGRNNSATVSTIKKICDGLEISIQDFFNSNVFFNLEQEIK